MPYGGSWGLGCVAKRGSARRRLAIAVCVLFTACSDAPAPGEPPRATKLAFVTQPTRAEGAVPISPAPQVAILDQFSNTDTNATYPVSVSLAGPSGGTPLNGTTTVFAVAGVATFTDLRIDEPRSDYTLVATAPALQSTTSAPFRVALAMAAITSGSAHTCGVTTSSFAYCWGWNRPGQLGDGTTEPRLIPTRVTGGLTFRQVMATALLIGYRTCGALTEAGAYCWGSNDQGQLGDGTTEQRNTPTPVVGGSSIVQVAVGALHTCGVTGGRRAYCWGANGGGELGDSTTVSRLTPVAVWGDLEFVEVSAGEEFTCGVTLDHRAYCWGYNGWGELGDGTTVNQPVPTAVPGGLLFDHVSAGDRYACGVTTDSKAFCWGLNHYGQLGDGTTEQRLTPTLVVGGFNFVHVSAAFVHTCGVTANGAAYCWGANNSGELGDGTTTQRLVPTLVTGNLIFTRVAVGSNDTCGVTTANIAYCWGFNGDGQLGDGTTMSRLTPTPVAP